MTTQVDDKNATAVDDDEDEGIHETYNADDLAAASGDDTHESVIKDDTTLPDKEESSDESSDSEDESSDTGDTDTEEQAAVEESATKTFSEDILEIAHEWGYREGGALDPKEFVRKERNINETLKDTVGLLRDEVRERDRKIDGLIRRFDERSTSELKAQIKALEADADEAFEAVDKERFKAINDEIARLNAQIPTSEEVKKPAEQATERPKFTKEMLDEFDAWRDVNKWYDASEDNRLTAHGIDASIRASHPDWPNTKVLEKITERMDAILNPAPVKSQKRTADVIDASHSPARQSGKHRREAHEMSVVEQQAFKKFRDLGIFKTKQDYLDSIDKEG